MVIVRQSTREKLNGCQVKYGRGVNYLTLPSCTVLELSVSNNTSLTGTHNKFLLPYQYYY